MGAQRCGQRHLTEVDADDHSAGVHDVDSTTPGARTEHRLRHRAVVGSCAGVGDHALTHAGVAKVSDFVACLENVLPAVVADGCVVWIAQGEGPP